VYSVGSFSLSYYKKRKTERPIRKWKPGAGKTPGMQAKWENMENIDAK
jgi:hypothetical protein